MSTHSELNKQPFSFLHADDVAVVHAYGRRKSMSDKDYDFSYVYSRLLSTLDSPATCFLRQLATEGPDEGDSAADVRAPDLLNYLLNEGLAKIVPDHMRLMRADKSTFQSLLETLSPLAKATARFSKRTKPMIGEVVGMFERLDSIYAAIEADEARPEAWRKATERARKVVSKYGTRTGSRTRWRPDADEEEEDDPVTLAMLKRSASPTSVDVERLFSRAGQNVTSLRHNMLARKLAKVAVGQGFQDGWVPDGLLKRILDEGEQAKRDKREAKKRKRQVDDADQAEANKRRKVISGLRSTSSGDG
ncbi:hypothetical protein V8E36_001207 [Tilletia maclaganii]